MGLSTCGAQQVVWEQEVSWGQRSGEVHLLGGAEAQVLGLHFHQHKLEMFHQTLPRGTLGLVKVVGTGNHLLKQSRCVRSILYGTVNCAEPWHGHPGRCLGQEQCLLWMWLGFPDVCSPHRNGTLEPWCDAGPVQLCTPAQPFSLSATIVYEIYKGNKISNYLMLQKDLCEQS